MRFAVVLAIAAATASTAAAQPTYTKDISRIVQAKCQGCHRPNDIAPFALMTYDDAVTWAEDINRVVSNRIMPPWKPVPGHGDFRGAYNLTDDERQTLLDWIAAGTPQGDDADLPEAPPEQTSEWQLGDPDLVVQMAQVFDVPRRQDLYRCFVMPTGIDEDKWVSAVQVIPGNRQIVHHVLLFLDTSGKARDMDGADGNPGYDCFGGPGFPINGGSGLLSLLNLDLGLGGWVPGTRITPLPDGTALFLPRTADIVMQVHYFPNGRPGPDQTKVGIYYSKAPVQKRLRYLPLVNTAFQIEPEDPDKVVTASFGPVPFFFDAHAVQIAPHMHLLGRKIQVELKKRGEDPEDMVLIDDWDFNWQGFYTYKEPLALPVGSTLKLTCHFDNTVDNPKNPNDPLRVVGWGEGTQDEMCLAFIGFTLDREQLTDFNLIKPAKK